MNPKMDLAIKQVAPEVVKQIWNEAIEAVIALCEENDGYDYHKIRKLKK